MQNKNEVVKFALKNSVTSAHRKFGITRSTIYKWIRSSDIKVRERTKPVITEYSRTLYPQKFKEKCVDFIKTKPHFPSALRVASKKFGVPNRTLRRWYQKLQ